MHVLEHLRKEAAAAGSGGGGGRGGGVSEELEALMTDPVEISVRKAVRKTDVFAGGKNLSFEFTGERVLAGLCSGACASALAPSPLVSSPSLPQVLPCQVCAWLQ